MHNNFYFLKRLTSQLERILAGTVISECFSQNKDELILRFETNTLPFFIKASLGSGMSHLTFPETFNRARKNSIDLFPEIIGHRIQGLRQFKNERSFALLLQENKTLLFQLHGNRSNILLVDENTIQHAFKSNIPQGESIALDELDRHIDWSYTAFIQHELNPEKLYFTFGKVVWHYLQTHKYKDLAVEEKWALLQATLNKLEEPSLYITNLKNVLHLTLLPFDDSRKIEDDPIKASNTFFYSFAQQTGLEKEKAAILSRLKTRLKSSEAYYKKSLEKLSEIEQDTNYKTWADLIMAHLHEIRQGHTTVTLPDFYNENKQIEIKLKNDLSPQANAAVFYRKAKNQHLETDRIRQALQGKEEEIERIKNEIREVESIQDLKSLKNKFQVSAERKDKIPVVPYFEFIYAGYKIWVGRNAQMNDTLTLRYAYKEDLWLHAKDVSGSHVVIKYQPGKVIPKEVIERAAELAAYNSKRKNETLCPVIVTPKKFVRKRKGDPAGAVIVDREQVIMVEPRLEIDR